MSDKYLLEFEYARPLEELGGRQGITSDMIARSVAGGSKIEHIRSAILNKMDNGRFIKNNLKELVDIGDVVEIETKSRRYWAYTVDAGRQFLMKYNPKGDNRNKTHIYADFLADPVEIARGVALWQKQQFEKEALLKEQEAPEEKEVEVKEVEVKEVDPADPLVARIEKLEAEVQALKNQLATPTTLTRDQIVETKRILNTTAHHIAKSIGCLLEGKDPYAPVRTLLLNYVGEALGKDCTGFKWTMITPKELTTMLFILKTLAEEGITPKEEEEMRAAVQKWKDSGGWSKYKPSVHAWHS